MENSKQLFRIDCLHIKVVSKSVGVISSLLVFRYDPRKNTKVSFYKYWNLVRILIEISNSLIFSQNEEEVCIHLKEPIKGTYIDICRL